MTDEKTAGIVTVGSELVEGLRLDTNTAYIARRVSRAGFKVIETTSVGDDVEHLAGVISRLSSRCDLVIVTGGLGPTHDDITRDAASVAAGRALSSDSAIIEQLSAVAARHADAESRADVLTQALVLDGAEPLMPVTGTAPGQVLTTPGGSLVLLPGPPTEMAEMLDRVMASYQGSTAEPRELGVVGMPESDVQHAAQRALAAFDRVQLAVLASPGDVRVVLMDDGAGEEGLEQAANAVALEIGRACYTTSGETLAKATLSALFQSGLTLVAAESCTGGLVSAALTDVSGASGAFLGGVVAYANDVKIEALDVPDALIAQYGAVSEEVAAMMAEGALLRFGADVAISITGIAGPTGGTIDKPVGLVWYALAYPGMTHTTERRFPVGSRAAVRARAASVALDLVRRHALGD